MTFIIYISIIVSLILIVGGWIIYQKMIIKEMYKPSKKLNSTLLQPSILTYNIQKFPWSFKSIKKIAELFDTHSIILIQECYDELFSSLESYFPHYYICRGTMKGISLVNSGLAILSKYPIVKNTFIPYKNYNSFTYDCLTEKGFLHTTIDIDGKIVNIVNTHMQSCDYERYDTNAFLQMKELLAYSETLNEPYIIGGDFNIDIQDFKIRYKLLVYSPTDPTIYINFKTSKSKSTPSDGYEGLIFDYFITSNNVKMNPLTISSPYSDHNPVSSKIEF